MVTSHLYPFMIWWIWERFHDYNRMHGIQLVQLIQSFCCDEILRSPRLNRSKTFVRAPVWGFGESSRLKAEVKEETVNFRHIYLDTSWLHQQTTSKQRNHDGKLHAPQSFWTVNTFLETCRPWNYDQPIVETSLPTPNRVYVNAMEAKQGPSR